ncbi:MAG: VRR-NUC domain-containing protein [Halieaceae bacterium]|nr:VRR-NUC domain-containing protein [Halieaceae bacterium]
MATDKPAELAPHYYRDNFLALCDTVETQYADLLLPGERSWLRCFRALSFDAQCLYVRLVSRVGPWFREGKLAYPELGAIAAIVDSLLAAGLAETAVELSAAELGGLYTRAELLQAFAPLLGRPFPGNKPDLLAAIEALELDQAGQRDLLTPIDDGRIIAPLGLAEVQLLQVLFFGNRRQSLTEFVLSDLGVARYYPYSLNREHRLFPRREALDEYLACGAISDSWYELRELEDPAALPALAQELLTLDVRFPSSENRWHRLCNGLARDLERLGELELAGQLYARSRRHPARERRLRILERSQDWAGALQLGDEILAEPWCEEERDAAERVLPRVQRKLGCKPAPRRRDDFAGLMLELPREDAPVELLAARQLETQWRAVHYVENALMNTLFGLAFWEQIFTPVPGAFHNPFQSAPTDMYSPEFRARRKRVLASRMAELGAGELGPELQEAWRNYAGFQSHWVDSRWIDEALVAEAARIIPDDHLLAIWERMLFDPGENRRGFPDLVALGEEPGEYCLIEVKGPGDALQQSQKRWLRFFARQGIPAAVAWVAWKDAGDSCGDA